MDIKENKDGKNTPKDGMAFIGIGLFFLLLTFHIVFALFVLMAKVLFYIIGGGMIILGIVTIIKEHKNKKQ